MNLQNFQSLIQSVTSRNFIIKSNDENILFDKEYVIQKTLPILQRNISFKWKAPKSNEKMLKSFITAFCNKYFEPNPEAYNKIYGGKQYFWNEKTDEQKEYAYFNHRSNMYSKKHLLEQIESNFNKKEIETALCRYGFYNTEYGIGIFCFWETDFVKSSINKMKNHLNELNIPYSNEYSDARWVYRFKINITKQTHLNIIENFNKTL